jgi:hypothetical protein
VRDLEPDLSLGDLRSHASRTGTLSSLEFAGVERLGAPAGPRAMRQVGSVTTVAYLQQSSPG